MLKIMFSGIAEETWTHEYWGTSNQSQKDSIILLSIIQNYLRVLKGKQNVFSSSWEKEMSTS